MNPGQVSIHSDSKTLYNLLSHFSSHHLYHLIQIEFEAEFGELTETRKEKIYKAMNDSVSYGYDLRSTKHRYFFVDQFYETDFRKQSPRASMGTRIFDLTKILETNEVPDVKTIAELLRNKTWQ